MGLILAFALLVAAFVMLGAYEYKPRAFWGLWCAACVALITSGCANQPTAQRTTYGCPSAHADAFEACYALLESSFPDTPRDGWEILECGDLGVLATDLTGRDETFAVTTAGDVYHVDEACGWTLLASD